MFSDSGSENEGEGGGFMADSLPTAANQLLKGDRGEQNAPPRDSQAQQALMQKPLSRQQTAIFKEFNPSEEDEDEEETYEDENNSDTLSTKKKD